MLWKIQQSGTSSQEIGVGKHIIHNCFSTMAIWVTWKCDMKGCPEYMQRQVGEMLLG